MHRYGTKVIYQNMLDTARILGNQELGAEESYRCFEAARAFAHGFISHVAADHIFHPYVNRDANNPWTGEKHGTSAHAGVETVIDNLLWSKYGDFNIQVDCAQRDNSSFADYPVRELLKTSLYNTYSDQSWLLELLELPVMTEEESHPINQAFRAVRQWTALTEGLQMVSAYNVNDIIQHLKGLSFEDITERMALNAEQESWCDVTGNEDLRYSAEYLFDVAINAATSAIEMGEKYVNGEIQSFENCGVPFLERDYNIDTGLPSDDNTRIDLAQDTERFAVETQLLIETIIGLESSQKQSPFLAAALRGRKAVVGSDNGQRLLPCPDFG